MTKQDKILINMFNWYERKSLYKKVKQKTDASIYWFKTAIRIFWYALVLWIESFKYLFKYLYYKVKTRW